MTVVTQTTTNGQTTTATHTLDFTYDASGSPMTVTYDGTTYYYATNLQGDVVAILDGSGNRAVNYTYDAWGNVQACSGTLSGTLGYYNPLCYRGYVYDPEYKLYYLQSRYYNPGLGRFLNADAFASTGQGLLGNNMFAYCNNNPVNKIDPNGEYNVAIDDGIFRLNIGRGEGNSYGSQLHITNPRKVDSWKEVIVVSVVYIIEVVNSDPVQDLKGLSKMRKGVVQMKKGISLFALPDPIPIVDELLAAIDIAMGFAKIVTGLGESMDWEK